MKVKALSPVLYNDVYYDTGSVFDIDTKNGVALLELRVVDLVEEEQQKPQTRKKDRSTH